MAEHLELGPDEFAFYFETDSGVDATALANFLKRAATVARQSGGDLRVVGVRQGSLAVVIKAIKNSTVSQGAVKEFSEKPIDTTIKISGAVAAIVSAIVYAMSPAQSGITPLAKAAVEVVEKHNTTQIIIVTTVTNTVIMNYAIASELRAAEKRRYARVVLTEDATRLPQPVIEMIDDARLGNLIGDAAFIGDELHFRPEGYRYWVPVDVENASERKQLNSGGRFRVSGLIATQGGQPDRIVVDWAEPIMY